MGDNHNTLESRMLPVEHQLSRALSKTMLRCVGIYRHKTNYFHQESGVVDTGRFQLDSSATLDELVNEDRPGSRTDHSKESSLPSVDAEEKILDLLGRVDRTLS